MTNERFERGLRLLRQIDGQAGEAVATTLERLFPDMGKLMVEFGFGDVYARPGMNLRDREIATIAALTALGTAAPQLKVHVHGGLNVGLSKEEILEIILQMALYAGFPAALNGLFAASEVFAERGLADG